jgi:cytochrome c oxidase assembly protein subunit 15
MDRSPAVAPLFPRWLSLWAALTIVVTLAQLSLGSIVTSLKVGMADPTWPTSPLALFFDPTLGEGTGIYIEHTHRFLGHIVGCCVVVLAVGLWLGEASARWRLSGILAVVAMAGTLLLGFTYRETALWAVCVAVCLVCLTVFLTAAARRHDAGFWIRSLGLVAVAGVIFQGLLGGFRVQFNALLGTDLSIVHGTFAQVYLAFLAGLAFLIARGGASGVSAPVPAGLRRLSLGVALVVLVQVILGALLRHTPPGLWLRLWQRAHLLGAFVVVVGALWLGRAILDSGSRDRLATGLVLLLGILVIGQLLLGVEAWMVKFGSGTLPPEFSSEAPKLPTWGELAVRTAHVLTGSGILAVTTVLAFWARRSSLTAAKPGIPSRPLEGAA